MSKSTGPQSEASESAARAFIDDARELPVMPPVAAEVVRKAEDPDSDVNAICELISRDAGLTLRVLKIANSSFYAMPREIETMQQAVVLLGFSTLRSVVVAAALKDVFARFGLAERMLWDHAVAGGVAASTVAREVNGFSRDEVFIGGLVHDVGKLAMHAQGGDDYQEVTRRVQAGESDAVTAEQELFGFDHACVGGLLLERWGLPERLADAVAGHHDPEHAAEVAKPLAALLQVADRICLQLGLGRRQPQPDLEFLDCAGAHLLGLQDADASGMVDAFKDAHARERDLFA